MTERDRVGAGWRILEGDCVEQMRGLDEASIDAVVCDPPYGLEFMGKEWDRLGALTEEVTDTENRDGNWTSKPFGGGGQRVRYGSSVKSMQEWHHAWATEALRVLKPGGHLLAFGGTRTYHRLACAVEDAGFEIRDSLMWLYGSGFPKSLDVSKAIDKAAGAEREVVGRYQPPSGKEWNLVEDESRPGDGGTMNEHKLRSEAMDITAPATPEARRWQGWGTALKPAHEPIVVARKPLSGTVAANVERFGTGALNVDGCRVGITGGTRKGTFPNEASVTAYGNGLNGSCEIQQTGSGRWPANVALSPEAAEELDRQSGELHSQDPSTRQSRSRAIGVTEMGTGESVEYADRGGASRFFYTAKASRAERNAGLDGFEEGPSYMVENGSKTARSGDGIRRERTTTTRNAHPTVKPVDLMRWLVRLVTPPGGTVLDCFLGSGTTGIAAHLEGFGFIGIEREAEYVEIAKARIEWWSQFPPGTDTDAALGVEARERVVRDSGQASLLDVA